MDVDLTEHLDPHIPGYEYLWNCAICLKPAISGVVLSFQWIEFFHDSVFFDLDNSSWVKCYKCNHCFHSKLFQQRQRCPPQVNWSICLLCLNQITFVYCFLSVPLILITLVSIALYLFKTMARTKKKPKVRGRLSIEKMRGVVKTKNRRAAEQA